MDISGATAGVCDVNGADAIDWEDMASYSKEGKPYLLVADTGDNGRRRKKYQLYRIPERHPDQAPLAVDQTVHFKFDKGPCDCEAIAYDATLDQVILIDKGWSLRCRVFTLDWPVKATKKTQLAKQVAVLKIAGITGMDISPDGRRAIVLTYGPAYEFVRDADETWKRAFARPGREIRMPVRRQGEAICYGADGKMLFVTSEKLPTPLFRLAVVDEPPPPRAHHPSRRSHEVRQAPMKYEVERKFRLRDPESFLRQATAAGANFGAAITQVDEYFAHPSRDFGSTDEALRVRVTDGQCRITYKGPKVSAATKTRHEIELPFADSVRDPGPISALLVALGFRSVRKVQKLRRSAQLCHGDWQFSMDLDDVQGLGTFVELDTAADEDQIAAAERAMAAIAEQYGLSGEVTTSYLEMLLAAEGIQQQQ